MRDDAQDWEGAAERLLHGFGLSLLVPDGLYARVAEWVDRTQLGDRLVYYRVRDRRAGSAAADFAGLHPRSLARKLELKADSSVYAWLESEVARRFDYACCDTLEQFRREERAVTRAGQTKARGERHEKDDRHRIDDRARYVLGWLNDAKVSALESQGGALVRRMQAAAGTVAALKREGEALRARRDGLQSLAAFEEFRELDWASLAVEIERLEEERRQLQEASDTLRVLEGQLAEAEQALAAVEGQLQEVRGKHSVAEDRREQARAQLGECRGLLERGVKAAGIRAFDGLAAQLEGMRGEALGEHALTAESCDNRERDMRDWLQARIDAQDKAIVRLRDKIISAMRAYKDAYPLETREADVAVEAAEEYRACRASRRASRSC